MILTPSERMLVLGLSHSLREYRRGSDELADAMVVFAEEKDTHLEALQCAMRVPGRSSLEDKLDLAREFARYAVPPPVVKTPQRAEKKKGRSKTAARKGT